MRRAKIVIPILKNCLGIYGHILYSELNAVEKCNVLEKVLEAEINIPFSYLDNLLTKTKSNH